MTKMKKILVGSFAGFLAMGSLFTFVLLVQPKQADALEHDVTWGCLKYCGGDQDCIERLCK